MKTKKHNKTDLVFELKMEVTDLSNTSFKDVIWLQKFPLIKETILDYFALSPFYDRSCNNEVLRMQTKFSNVAVSVEDRLRYCSLLIVVK